LKPKYELAEVIDRFEEDFQHKHSPNAYVKRTLSALKRCRTSSLGGHVDKCDECGHIRISYNSCRNRHCPKCQNTQREAWVEDRKQDLLPVPYFHVVFTVPDILNNLFLQQPADLYNLLFSSTWETISQFSYTKLHAETGMVAILHTWGQNLSMHPHIHCVVPGGGINFKGKWKQVSTSENGKVFLFRVENLSRVFRGKFISALQKKLPQSKTFINDLYKTNWVVYAKEPFAGPEQVIEYLGRYTHKVAIGNHRLLKVDETGVLFSWRDYRDNNVKVMPLEGSEFLRRFCIHILPKRFVRIRHYGLLSTARRQELRELQQSFGINTPKVREKKRWKDVCREHLNYDPDICPQCGKGHMSTIEMFFAPRPPPLPMSALNEYFVKS
jgi:Putative transposase/Transposase zinc-binding domain